MAFLDAGEKVVSMENRRDETGGGGGLYEALRPMGETLIMPLRNSIKVPLDLSAPGALLYPQQEKLVPLDRNIQIRDLMQDKVRHLLVFFLAQPLDKVVARQGLSEPEGSEAVLGKTVVEQIDYCTFIS